ncbi:Hypothetical protein CINCED_3A017829 [Cinara cedri]|uniref:Uncharacterized protein n=1 Tax=Cinara cedri TaxID=506608 RepID=A0A5E4MGR2_9HEMI|nr:Hypothetical protein CINCED_3A017829 [Cinara cedri]
MMFFFIDGFCRRRLPPTLELAIGDIVVDFVYRHVICNTSGEFSGKRYPSSESASTYGAVSEELQQILAPNTHRNKTRTTVKRLMQKQESSVILVTIFLR